MTIADLKRGKIIIRHHCISPSDFCQMLVKVSKKKKRESATSVWPNVFSITGSNSKAHEGPVIHKSC